MTHAYDELYLEEARRTLGSMLDFAVNDLRYDADSFFDMFLGTGLADEFSHGDPTCTVGRSGEELALEVLRQVKRECCHVRPSFRPGRSEAYWGGWILAGYQWYRSLSFRRISEALGCREIIAYYHPYHEMDERQFYDVMDQYMKKSAETSRLQRLRKYAGLSQSMLANRAGIPVRTIQQYEQKQKNINHAKADTLFRLSSALDCRPEELLEMSGI